MISRRRSREAVEDIEGGGGGSGKEAHGLDDFKELLAGRLFTTDRFPNERHNLKSGNLGNVGEDEMGGERKKEVQYIQVAYGFDPNKTYILCFVRRALIHHLLSVLSSSVQDGVHVRSRSPVVVALRRVLLTSASPRLKPMTTPSRVVLSSFAVVGINFHHRVSAPSLLARHLRQRDPTKI
ncbi:hypothetical protein YC2023_065805 [Brassica napus]